MKNIFNLFKSRFFKSYFLTREFQDWNKNKFKYKHKLTARVNGGILWLDKPHIFGGALIHQNNWHVGDYNLFWENIRSNVTDRIRSFDESESNH